MNPKTFRSRRKTTLTPRDSPALRKRGPVIQSQLVRIRAKSCCSHTKENYNKYYIQPELRYRNKAINPKQVPENYAEQTFLYRNLHNKQFWNWAHPLDAVKLKNVENPAPDKSSVGVLQKFRIYIEQKSGKRVPLIIKDYLNQFSTRQ